MTRRRQTSQPVPLTPTHRRDWRTLWRRCTCGLTSPCVDRRVPAKPRPFPPSIATPPIHPLVEYLASVPFPVHCGFAVPLPFPTVPPPPPTPTPPPRPTPQPPLPSAPAAHQGGSTAHPGGPAVHPGGQGALGGPGPSPCPVPRTGAAPVSSTPRSRPRPTAANTTSPSSRPQRQRPRTRPTAANTTRPSPIAREHGTLRSCVARVEAPRRECRSRRLRGRGRPSR
jgi:hypothetical protein